MAMDATRNLVYISAKANQVVRVVDVAQNKIIAVYGTFSTSAGASYSGDGGPASSATMYQPLGLAVDTVNNLLYVADSSNRVIRVINVTSNIINTFAGDYYYGDTRLAVNARLTLAHKMAIDSVNNLVYIAEYKTTKIIPFCFERETYEDFCLYGRIKSCIKKVAKFV
jgi:hypothetical protein